MIFEYFCKIFVQRSEGPPLKHLLMSAPADLSRNFSISFNFMDIKEPFYLTIHFGCLTKWTFADPLLCDGLPGI